MEIRKNKFYTEACSKVGSTQDISDLRLSRNETHLMNSPKTVGVKQNTLESRYLGNYKTCSNLNSSEGIRAESALAANER